MKFQRSVENPKYKGYVSNDLAKDHLKILFALSAPKNWNYEKDYDFSVTDRGGFEEKIPVFSRRPYDPWFLVQVLCRLATVD